MCYGRPVTPVSGMTVPQSDFNWSQAENLVNNISVRYYVIMSPSSLAVHFNTAFYIRGQFFYYQYSILKVMDHLNKGVVSNIPTLWMLYMMVS